MAVGCLERSFGGEARSRLETSTRHQHFRRLRKRTQCAEKQHHHLVAAVPDLVGQAGTSRSKRHPRITFDGYRYRLAATVREVRRYALRSTNRPGR